MKKAPAITCLFVDIGGVLLTNGWDQHARSFGASCASRGPQIINRKRMTKRVKRAAHPVIFSSAQKTSKSEAHFAG
jgi:hypothetical protein